LHIANQKLSFTDDIFSVGICMIPWTGLNTQSYPAHHILMDWEYLSMVVDQVITQKD
jgi:hypothetical protein